MRLLHQDPRKSPSRECSKQREEGVANAERRRHKRARTFVLQAASTRKQHPAWGALHVLDVSMRGLHRTCPDFSALSEGELAPFRALLAEAFPDEHARKCGGDGSLDLVVQAFAWRYDLWQDSEHGDAGFRSLSAAPERALPKSLERRAADLEEAIRAS